MSGPTRVTEVTAGGLRNFSWTPSDFGLEPGPLESLRVETPAQSAAKIRDVLSGTPGPARDIVVLNAAAALWVAGKAETPRACAALAATAIDLGAAAELLKRLMQMSHS